MDRVEEVECGNFVLLSWLSPICYAHGTMPNVYICKAPLSLCFSEKYDYCGCIIKALVSPRNCLAYKATAQWIS